MKITTLTLLFSSSLFGCAQDDADEACKAGSSPCPDATSTDSGPVVDAGPRVDAQPSLDATLRDTGPPDPDASGCVDERGVFQPAEEYAVPCEGLDEEDCRASRVCKAAEGVYLRDGVRTGGYAGCTQIETGPPECSSGGWGNAEGCSTNPEDGVCWQFAENIPTGWPEKGECPAPECPPFR